MVRSFLPIIVNQQLNHYCSEAGPSGTTSEPPNETHTLAPATDSLASLAYIDKHVADAVSFQSLSNSSLQSS